MNKSALEYNSISKLLHWIIALLLLISIPTAYYMSGLLDENNMKWTLYDLHESLGITILILMIVRIIWIRKHSVIAGVKEDSKLQKIITIIVHRTFYALLIFLPLCGWVMNSAGGYPVPVFGIELPQIVGKNDFLASITYTLHFYIGYLLVILILIHIAGVIMHLLKNNNILTKMTFHK